MAKAKPKAKLDDMKMGATVYIRVAAVLWGQFLRILEHYPDLQVIDLIDPPIGDDKLAVIRTLAFPSIWDQCELDCFINTQLPPNQCLHFELHGAGVTAAGLRKA